MYLTLSQTAQELDRTERQVRYLIKTGVLSPINQDTYKRDGGYRFSPDIVMQVKKKLTPEGISLRMAAEIVGITPQYLNKLALSGEIRSNLVAIGNKKERRFNKKDCYCFKNQMKSRTHKSISHFGEKLQLYKNNQRLFKLASYNDEIVRIVKTQPITILKADGILYELDSNHVLPPSEEWPEKTYQTKKGFVTFQFPIPRNAEHTTYNVIYELIQELGPKNVQVFEQAAGDYLIRCRQGKIYIKEEYAEVLKRHIIDGDTLSNSFGIELLSNIMSEYVHLPRELFQKIEQLADKRSISTQEQIIDAIKIGLESFKSEL
ncbi:hypothetical protein IIE26_27265 (plasmid) [Cytobacillus oceanisediminis]|uniref:hypothetical protein n=1 Tax=Cytobacillus oceanisediminis TaxID=665099 RepID=UPI0018641EA1|nr:hypothetical protein [Cytobacillus oceanisediminis]QOK30071.1 hypothetical protein IIE26_27265 [Cytobacillus oceanisediminis]